VGAPAPSGRRKNISGVIYRENFVSLPQAEQESIFGHFCCAGIFGGAGVVHLVVLACVLKATTKKGLQLFLRKKCTPRENLGYAYMA